MLQSVGTTPNDAASKKSKRKSKKTNGQNGADTNGNKDEPPPPEPSSYAEAVKEDPVVAEKRQAEGPHESREVTQNGEEGSEETPKPTPAGDMTFAQAVKESPADDNEEPHSEQQPDQRHAKEREASQSTPDISQASTTVDYPEIRSDDDEDEERQQRRRDKEKAAVVGGARWAPLGVPVRRRLQTAAVLMHCVGIGLSLSIFFAFCAVPIFWPISTSHPESFSLLGVPRCCGVEFSNL